jgi:predicted dithiol-disulfide oxidoreductase (DUF899 family)
MTRHKVGTQEEWRAARNALHEREQELPDGTPNFPLRRHDEY